MRQAQRDTTDYRD